MSKINTRENGEKGKWNKWMHIMERKRGTITFIKFVWEMGEETVFALRFFHD